MGGLIVTSVLIVLVAGRREGIGGSLIAVRALPCRGAIVRETPAARAGVLRNVLTLHGERETRCGGQFLPPQQLRAQLNDGYDANPCPSPSAGSRRSDQSLSATTSYRLPVQADVWACPSRLTVQSRRSGENLPLLALYHTTRRNGRA
jgi:hypothetical protein